MSGEWARIARELEGDCDCDELRAERDAALAEARQLREAIRAHENLHRPDGPDGPDGADGPIEMDGWPCCNDDRLLWAAAVAEGAEDRPKFPGLHDRPDTGKECHYLAVTMPHGGLFCNKCGWAEGAEDRGQTDG